MNKFVLAIFAVCCISTLEALNVKPNVIGGEVAKAREFPSVVGIWVGDKANGKKFLCGGTLLQNNVVLTTARCMQNEEGESFGQSLLEVRAGSVSLSDEDNTDRKISHVQKVVRHENWNEKDNENDIALLILLEPLYRTDAIKAISLPDIENDPEFKGGVVVGWGKVKKDDDDDKVSDVLKKAELTSTLEAECSKKFGDKFKTGQYFCAGSDKAATCKGDEGSPLVVEVNGVQKVYGVLANADCETDTIGGLFTDVGIYGPWIQKNLNENKGKPNVKAPVAEKEFPSVVGIWIGDDANGKEFHCGGVLLQNNTVLTSARCLENEEGFKYGQSLMEVHAGSIKLKGNYSEVVHVQKVLRHEKWNRDTNENNVALLVLLETLDEKETIKPISLPDPEKDTTFTGGVVVGWGKATRDDEDFSNLLQKAQLDLTAADKCTARFGANVTSGHFCAGSEKAATCTGDEGSPLIVDVNGVKKPFGIVANVKDCEVDTTGGLLTDVRTHVKWILEQLEDVELITEPPPTTSTETPKPTGSTETPKPTGSTETPKPTGTVPDTTPPGATDPTTTPKGSGTISKLNGFLLLLVIPFFFLH